MNPAEHFLQHAAECKFMAESAPDPASKAAWKGMAERWSRCAELAKQDMTRAREIRSRKQARSPAH